MDSLETYAEAKRVTRQFLTGWARARMHHTAVFYWRCRVTTLLRRARGQRA